MKKLFLITFSLVAFSLAAFPLEWNVNYDTAVPYEVELSPAKLGLKGQKLEVRADGKPIVARMLEGKAKGAVRLRFTVPAGTKELSCEPMKGNAKVMKGDEIANLFSGALVGKSGWKFQGGTIESSNAGLVFVTKGQNAVATYTIDLPAENAGQAAQFEIEVANVAKLAWPNNIYVEQLNANGRVLPETVTDPRWSSHIRPVGVKTLVKEAGRLHPLARKLRLVLTLSAPATEYDFHGLKIENPEMKLAKLAVTRLALRPGALLPFPKYDDANFDTGVSGEAGDCAIRLGGERQTTLWYQTRSMGSWAHCRNYFGDDAQIRDESQIFFPVGSGTVEAWFKPSAFKDQKGPLYLFAGSQHNVRSPRLRWEVAGIMFAVTYDAAKGEFGFYKKDLEGHEATATGKAEFPVGQWSHVAATWQKGKTAAVWVNGQKILEADISKLGTLDLKRDPRPNDRDVVEHYLGSCYKTARNIGEPYPAGKAPYFDGLADAWRVSSGVRYTAAFTPEKRFTKDGDTRALFDFDRSFTGVAGGIGAIPLSFYSLADRVSHRLTVGEKTIQYYADTVQPKFEPSKVLDVVNYPTMPTVDDYLSARKVETKTASVKIGETMNVTAPKGVFTDFIEIANESAESLVHPMLVGEGEVDPRSFGDIKDTLLPDPLPAMERANRIFQYVIGASDYFMNHSAYFPLNGGDKCGDVEYQALMMLSGYCGFECGPLNSMTKNIFACSGGLPAAQTAGYGHSFEEVFFDGKNHVYDLSAQSFFPAFDNESAAYLEEMENQPALKTRAYGNPDHFIRNGTRNGGANEVPYQPKVAMTIRPGERFRVWFDNNGEVNELQCSQQTDRLKERPRFADYTDIVHADQGEKGWRVFRINRFFPHYGNGFLRFDGKPDAANEAFEDLGTNFIYHVKSCYPVVAARYAATLKKGGAAKVSISTDLGKTYRPLPEGLLRYEVRARYDYLVRVEAPLAEVDGFSAMTEVQVNVRVFPGRLKAGENELTLRGTGTGEAKVTVGWRSNVQRLAVKGAVYAGTIPGAETALVMIDPTKGEATFDLEGATAAAKAEVADGTLAATVKGGKLVLSADRAAKGFATVKLVDGDAERYVSVLVCAGARLVTAADMTPANDARLVPAGKETPHPTLVLSKQGAGLAAAYEKASAGKYAVMGLFRFNAHQPLNKRGGKYVELKLGGATINFGSPVNCSCNFYKAMYGREGERGNWKWDYPNNPDFRYYVEMMNIIDLKASDRLVMNYRSNPSLKGEVEVAAVLLVPEPDETLYCDLVKVLCGLNTQKGRVR